MVNISKQKGTKMTIIKEDPKTKEVKILGFVNGKWVEIDLLNMKVKEKTKK